jgi:diguanylate cyclase (GGDEF)-like protein
MRNSTAILLADSGAAQPQQGGTTMSARAPAKSSVFDEGQLMHVMDGQVSAGPLAAEVKWLEAQLAAARAQIVALEAVADLDPLLDILSRRGFERELRRVLDFIQRYGNVAALLYIDVDQLKPINDMHGHAAGDAVLRAVADTLIANVRPSDIVARLGGDEFAVLLWNIGEPEALAKATALEMAVAEQQVLYWTANLSCAVSAGVTCLLPTDQPNEALDRADRAMYARKAERQSMARAEVPVTQ